MRGDHASGWGSLLSFSPRALPRDFFLRQNKTGAAMQARTQADHRLFVWPLLSLKSEHRVTKIQVNIRRLQYWNHYFQKQSFVSQLIEEIQSRKRIHFYWLPVTTATHKQRRAKLQNTRPLFCISLNNKSAYCVIPRSLKRSDKCKWCSRVFWSCSQRSGLPVV